MYIYRHVNPNLDSESTISVKIRVANAKYARIGPKLLPKSEPPQTKFNSF